MKIKEPLDEECPNCGKQLQILINWILQEGQVCPHCKEDLSVLRLSIKNSLESLQNNWREFFNTVEIGMQIEDELSILFEDKDLFENGKNEGKTTVSDIINATYRLLKQKEKSINQDEVASKILKIICAEFSGETFEITPNTKIIDLGKVNSS